MTNETIGQLTTAVLVIAGWYLNHRQNVKHNNEIVKNTAEIQAVKVETVEVKSMVNGPLLQSIRETADLARQIATLTGLPADEARAKEKQRVLEDRLASKPHEHQ